MLHDRSQTDLAGKKQDEQNLWHHASASRCGGRFPGIQQRSSKTKSAIIAQLSYDVCYFI
jgi:hypothetical protein